MLLNKNCCFDNPIKNNINELLKFLKILSEFAKLTLTVFWKSQNSKLIRILRF